MIELRRIVLVNWHLLTRADLDLTGDAAILGQNRSGKSTLIDLIQAVMAGGSKKYYRFNRSAGEGGGRSDRTLAGYCLGQLSEDSFQRDEAWTHIGLVFEDTSGEKPPVSIGLSIEAMRGQPAEVAGRFVAQGVRLDTDMFLEEAAGGGLKFSTWAAVRRRLETECASTGGQLLSPDDARTFIREYMRILFTNRRTSDPERFIRSFVLALSFVDMTSVELFVRRYLLEQNDIDIRELRESIQRYREIQKTIHELERRLEALRALRVQIADYARLQAEEDVARGLERLALLVEAGAALFQNVRELRSKRAEQDLQAADLERVEAEIQREQEAVEAVQRQLAASNVAGQRALVQGEIREIDRQHATVGQRLQARFMVAAVADQLLNQREKLSAISPGELFRAIEAVRQASMGLSPPDWPRDPAAMDGLLSSVRAAALSRVPKATERRNDAIIWTNRLADELKGERERLDAARAGRVPLQHGTQKLMDALRAEGMSPRTLCEVAEVVDERWRGALEAVLVRDREAIIVEPDHAFRATEIFRRGREAYPGCRVANTRRLQGQAGVPVAGTLASMLRSEDTLAMAFVVHRIGNVRLAESQEELLAGGRAMMADGSYHDGLVTEMRRAPDLKIGRAAAPLMQAQLVERIGEIRTNLATHEQAGRFFEDVIRKLEECAREPVPGEQLDTIVLELDGLAERRGEAEARLARIAATVDPLLLDTEQRGLAAIRSLGLDRDELLGRKGSLSSEISDIRKRIGAGESQPGSLLCLTQRRRVFALIAPSRSAARLLRAPYRALGARTPARIATEMVRKASELRDAYQVLEREIRSALGHYMINFPDGLEGYAQASITGVARPWVEEGVAALEGNELIQYRHQADEAADRVSRLFRTTFIHELNSRFGALHAEMEALSKALRSRPLHGETYQLHEVVKPEFADLYQLARDSEHDEDALDALFGRAEPRDDRHARALRQVEQLLADEGHDFSVHQDYRNYFTFDLQMRDVATGRTKSFDRHRGVASGAERQVPFYVVIGAALASIYHGSRRSAAPTELGIGLAVFDEAFSKMDGPNQRTLLDFYRAIGLQVVIAAPTEKRNVVYENLDCIIDVFRSGDVALAESIRIKQHARDEMRAANPQHVTDEELLLRLGTDARAAE